MAFQDELIQNLPHFTTVSLVADAAPFKGFMLDARKCDTCKSTGRFVLTDPGNNALICNVSPAVHPLYAY